MPSLGSPGHRIAARTRGSSTGQQRRDRDRGSHVCRSERAVVFRHVLTGVARDLLPQPSNWVAVVHRLVYRRGVSGKPPQTYILHTFFIAVTIVVTMILFLRSQWGH